ncbi:MAG: GFA family protein [Reyranellaceae bacterium]
MTETLTGGCSCGKVRYECSAQPIVQLICHCRDCQQASGSAYAAVIFVPGDRLRLTEAEPKYHEVKGASGRRIERGFCGECGSPVLARWPENSLYQVLQASSLDDPSLFKPSSEIWLSRAHSWHTPHPNTVKFDNGPSAEAVRAPMEAYFAARK